MVDAVAEPHGPVQLRVTLATLPGPHVSGAGQGSQGTRDTSLGPRWGGPLAEDPRATRGKVGESDAAHRRRGRSWDLRTGGRSERREKARSWGSLGPREVPDVPPVPGPRGAVTRGLPGAGEGLEDVEAHGGPPEDVVGAIEGGRNPGCRGSSTDALPALLSLPDDLPLGDSCLPDNASGRVGASDRAGSDRGREGTDEGLVAGRGEGKVGRGE